MLGFPWLCVFPRNFYGLVVIAQYSLLFCLQLKLDICRSEDDLDVEPRSHIFLTTIIPMSILSFHLYAISLKNGFDIAQTLCATLTQALGKLLSR